MGGVLFGCWIICRAIGRTGGLQSDCTFCPLSHLFIHDTDAPRFLACYPPHDCFFIFRNRDFFFPLFRPSPSGRVPAAHIHCVDNRLISLANRTNTPYREALHKSSAESQSEDVDLTEIFRIDALVEYYYIQLFSRGIAFISYKSLRMISSLTGCAGYNAFPGGLAYTEVSTEPVA